MREDLMLKEICERIWDLARPYLNTRKNDTHTEIAAGLAQQLLAQEGGDEDIVMPAIILHDTGWKKVPEDVQSKAFGPKATLPEWNRVHEVEGARIAGHILRSVNYPNDKILEIQEIIKEHDSRKEPLSLNDSIVKDADKLWRYSQNAFQINAIRFALTADENVERLRRNLEPWFLTKSGKRMAREALEERIQELKETDAAAGLP
ncbi:MAG: HD domain-containing protein [Deltaproteobacteria bacterium]|nr:HD domain-containing protein [Deltaproteobacteria bacterium]